MRFKAFLEQQEATAPHTTKLDMDEAWAWVKNHAYEFCRGAHDKEIVRGMNVEGINSAHLGDTNTFVRKSKNTNNFYTLLVDSSAHWAGYPKRSRAFIGSTETEAPTGYGFVYIAFPADDAKIGICSKCDMWQSFSRTLDPLSIRSLKVLNELIVDLGKSNGEKLEETDAAALRKHFGRYNIELLERLKDTTEFEKFSKFGYSLDQLIKLMKSRHLSNLEQALEEILDPDNNGFEHCLAKDWGHYGVKNREVWIEGRVIFVPPNWMNPLRTEFGENFKKEFGWS